MTQLTSEARGPLPVARTEKGRAYEEFLEGVRARANDPAHAADYAAVNAELVALRGQPLRGDPGEPSGGADIIAARGIGGPGMVHHDQVLQSMSVAFQNDEYIGERLLPVILTGGALGGMYWEYSKRDKLAYPDDEIGDDGTVNELTMSRSKASFSLTPRSLREKLDQFTLQNQAAPLNELMDIQGHVLDGLAFNRELRIATLLSTAGTYSGNTLAVAAGDVWTNGGGDPGGVVDYARAQVWSGQGPGRWVLAMSLDVYNVLKRHPTILDSFKYTGAGAKFATRQMLAEYFEVDEVLVGMARKDTANIAATASYSRIWGNVLILARVAKTPSLRNAALGYVIQDMATQADQWFKQDEGGKGAYVCRATHADQEKVVAPSCGFLVTNPIG